MSPGAALEHAIKKAAEHYAKVGRAELHKQHTPRAFSGRFVGNAPIDFRGWALTEIGTREPLYLEAKHTGDGRLVFGDKGIDAAQLDAMRDAVARRVRAIVVVAFAPPIAEVFAVDAVEVLKFADTPWRSSLSLDWCRAHGELVKVERAPHLRVWFLDCRPHPDKASAHLRVAQERASAEGRVVELYPARGLKGGARADRFRELMQRKPARNAPESERIAWLAEMTELDLERAIAQAKKDQARPVRGNKKRGGWMGGR